ncbi:GNAT family N-acetyltransferase [Streptomyces sp. ET3-23]|uniref:GNAT family N-acetyltransferase n=1 Tax=Streptomyces sp. ET3-23 TaxID=2885643 RepID=UPI001D0FB12E|nr:GNAT family N-acetyltransferase [Streptomyces sp. ET3-23]MCC2276758.1 GNAT family N-acetyltransferase [Streptomyces sp. ET3-23]
MLTFPPETIRTDRLTLLPLQAGHAEEMATVLSDPDLHTFTGSTPETAQALRARYERWAAGSPDPAASRGACAEIAWVVGTPWQRQGIATEAARGLVAWLRSRSHSRSHVVHTVVTHIHPDHRASAAVATAAGLAPTSRRQDGEVRWQLVTCP